MGDRHVLDLEGGDRILSPQAFMALLDAAR